MPWLSKRLGSLEIVYCICTGWALLFEISLLILTWKRKEEKNSLLVGVSLCINNTIKVPTLPSGPAVKGWVKEEWLVSGGDWWAHESRSRFLPKGVGNTGRRWLGVGNCSNATCFQDASQVTFLHSNLSHSCVQLLQPSHRITRAQLSISVTNGRLSVCSCRLSHRFCINPSAWNIWLRVPSWSTLN